LFLKVNDLTERKAADNRCLPKWGHSWYH